MKSQTKARIFGTIAILLMVWPFIHRYLAEVYDINPWEFWGIAMYCTPHHCRVELFDHSSGEPARIDQPSMRFEVRRKVRVFQYTRSDLGQFLPPRELSRTILAEYPDITDLEIAVTVTRLDGKSAMMQDWKMSYRYGRED